MLKLIILIVPLLFQLCHTGHTIKKDLRYEATWESLESRPLPGWFDEAKIGIFIHWGVYSVPGFGGYEDYKNHYAEWFWNDITWGSTDHVRFMKENYPPNFKYQDFASQFRAEFFEPENWAELFQKSGAKYVVLTSKHHDGFSLYPSKYSFSWNAGDVGPNRDLVGDLANAIREKTDLKFGLYHSLYEWFHPVYAQDRSNAFWTDDFVQTKVLPELYEKVNLYKPEVLWGDGEFDAHTDYWKAKEFLAWLYNESPVKDTIVTNDRWGNETLCRHGGFMTCTDQYNPGVLQPFKWENCMSIDRSSFGIRRNAKIEDYRSAQEIIKNLVETVACGGNLLLNIGPTADGMIEVVQQERLIQLGEWLQINGDAIYESLPWTHQNDTATPGVWYTSNPGRKQVYAISNNWPGTQIYLASVNPSSVNSIQVLGSPNDLTWTEASPRDGILISVPSRDEIKSEWAWAFVINEN